MKFRNTFIVEEPARTDGRELGEATESRELREGAAAVRQNRQSLRTPEGQ